MELDPSLLHWELSPVYADSGVGCTLDMLFKDGMFTSTASLKELVLPLSRKTLKLALFSNGEWG